MELLNTRTAEAAHAQPQAIGFIGLGWGAHVAETLFSGPAQRYFRLAAVCDADPGKVADFSARYPVKGYTRIEDLLSDASIPAIGLFSGPAGRSTLLRKIIQAGKDVMTTKPFELDPQAARSVLEEARRLGRTILVNSPAPEPPEYLAQIERWRSEYNLGRPISCRAEMLVSYREQADGRWLDDPALCPVAPIFRLGIYSINDLVRLFGPVSEVQVMGTRLFTGRLTPDNAQLGLRFENDALGTVHASFCVDNGQHYANSLTLNYERGTVLRNVYPVAYGQAEGSSRLHLVATRDRKVIRQEWSSGEISGAYPWELFHAAVTGQKEVPMPIEAIVQATQVVAAMARAEGSGKIERVQCH